MKFYDCSTAPSPRRARMFIAEKGLDIETVDISIARGEQLSAGFLAVNPHGTVPVLITQSGATLTENIAIASYLEDMFPDLALIGKDTDQRAQVFMWNAICETQGLLPIAEVLRNSNPHMKGRALTGPNNYEQIPQLAERSLPRVTLFAEMLNERLSKSKFVAGDVFSLADITAFVALDFARVIKVRVTEKTPALHAWYTAMKERPSATL